MSLFISADGGPSGLGQEAEPVSDLPGGKGGCQVGLPVFFLWFYPHPFLSIYTNSSDCV